MIPIQCISITAIIVLMYEKMVAAGHRPPFSFTQEHRARECTCSGRCYAVYALERV